MVRPLNDHSVTSVAKDVEFANAAAVGALSVGKPAPNLFHQKVDSNAGKSELTYLMQDVVM